MVLIFLDWFHFVKIDLVIWKKWILDKIVSYWIVYIHLYV